MSEALTAIFPTTTLQTCIVDLMRHSLDLEGAQTLAPAPDRVIPFFALPPASGRDLHHQRLGERARSPAQHHRCVVEGRQLLAPRDESICDSERGSLHCTESVKRSAHGRCRHCGRTARAHKDLANRRTWCPTAPTRINRLSGEEKRHLTHRISDTPDLTIGIRDHRFPDPRSPIPDPRSLLRSPIPDPRSLLPYSSQPAFERAIQTVEDAAKFSSCSENRRHGVIGHEPQPPTQLDLGFDFSQAANCNADRTPIRLRSQLMPFREV